MKILCFLLILACLSHFSLGFILPLIRKNHTLEATKRGNGEPVNLQGDISSIGEFYATISVGSPPQNFLVQVDTGSTDLLLYGTGCSGCTSSGSYSSDSSTQIYPCDVNVCAGCVSVSSSSACGFSDVYGSGATVSGYVVTDIFSVAGFTAIRLPFGYIQSVSGGTFQSAPVDGIWGLAYPSLSQWGGNSALDTIISINGLQNIFSMCLEGNNPMMSIGVDYTSIAGTQWTPIIQQAWYVVTVNDIKVNGNSLGLASTVYNDPHSIVDSGTTLFTLPPNAFTAFKAAFQSMCSSVTLHGICDAPTGKTLFDGYCYSMLPTQLSQYPSVTIVLNGATLSIPNTQYLLLTKTAYCMGVQQGTSGQSGSGTVLGDTIMQGFHVIFDKTNSRVGFAPLSSCPSPWTTTVQQYTTAQIVTTEVMSTGSIISTTASSANINGIVQLAKNLSLGAIIGIVVAGVAVLVVLLLCCLICCRSRNNY